LNLTRIADDARNLTGLTIGSAGPAESRGSGKPEVCAIENVENFRAEL
jgi:hypothetical protein